MKGFSTVLIILPMVLIMLVISGIGLAATNKVVLQIEGMS
jgi:hypothetical protein